MSTAVQAQGVIVETYYVTLPEQDLFTSFDTINSGANPPVVTIISIAIGGDTILYYDQWENGYEAVLNAPLDVYSSGASGCPPVNADGTQIWGNNNLCDGVAPGFAADTLGNGDVIVLENSVPIPRNPAAIRFDGGDKIGASFPVAVTRSAYPNQPGSVLAGATEVLKTNRWGMSYRAPVGEDVPGNTDPWDYARFFVMAGNERTEVFKNGVSQGIIGEGKTLVFPVNVNDHITANKPIQVNLTTGNIGSTYEMRWFSIADLEDWSDEYFMPVGLPANDTARRVAVWLYNPNQTSPITVEWQIGSTGTSGSRLIPPGQVEFGPFVGGSDGRNGTRFSTENGDPFYALAQVDAAPRAGTLYDWGFPLIPSEQLSPQVLIGYGIGCTQPGVTISGNSCNFSNTNNARNFVWVMPTSGSNVPIYVAYDGRLPVCPATPANYNQTFTLSALRIQTVQETGDLDMTGARIWTCVPGVNLAVAWGQDPLRSFSGDAQGLDMGTTVLSLPSVQLQKTAAFAIDDDEDNAISPGDSITYTIAIVNNGAFQATYSVSDTLPGGVTYVANSTVYQSAGGATIPVPDNPLPRTPFPLDEGGLSLVGGSPLTIQPGAVDQVRYVIAINADTDCTVTLTNGAEIIGDVGATDSTINDNAQELTVLVCNPGIRVEKSTNGQDADDPTGPFVTTGDPVEWTYTITNIGDVDLENISLSDDKLGAITSGCTPSFPAVLAAGESFTCTRNGVAEEGQYANLATVTANAVISPTQVVTDTDPSHYFGQSPAITLQKFTNGHDANTPTGPVILAGDVVTWEYIVVNTGNVTLTSVTVTDDQIGAISCPQTTLIPGASMTCSRTGIATAGQYANIGTVVATPPAGLPVTDTDPSHYFGTQPALEIKKFTNGEDADLPPGPTVDIGELVVWTYVVTNTGNVPLNIVVTDDQVVNIRCTRQTVRPGGQLRCNAYAIAQPGQYANLATATATYLGMVVTDSDPSHYFGQALPDPEPAIAIKKFTNGLDADEPPGPIIAAGSVVTWEYVVVNTGSITLTDVTVSDDQIGSVNCPEELLGIGDFMICTMTGIAAAGQYTNTAEVVASPLSDGPLVTDEDSSHYFGVEAAIAIKKFTNGEDADTPVGPLIPVGDPVTWSYVITNTGTVELQDIVVTDSQGVQVNCPQLALNPGETMTCMGDEGTAQPGPYANIGTVTGTPPVGAPVTDSDPSHYFGAEPSIALQKYTNGEDADTPTGPLVPVGDPVVWSYVVTNTGNLNLTNVTVTDDQDASVTCPQTTLAPGATMTCSAADTAVAGQYANVGTVTGTPPEGPIVMDSDASHYFGAQPGIAITKYTNGVDADSPTGPLLVNGDKVLWTYVISNTGNVPLETFQVTDSRGVAVACPRIGFISPGLSVTCFATGNAQIGQYANIGTVTSTPGIGDPLVDSNPSHYFGVNAGIELKKFTNGVDADEAPGPSIPIGDPVTWSYVVTNTGNVALTGVTVNDDQIGTVPCSQSTLGAGEVMTCTVTGTAVADQYANLADVIAIPPVGVEVVDDDPSHYFGSTPTSLPPANQPGHPYGYFLPQVSNGARND